MKRIAWLMAWAAAGCGSRGGEYSVRPFESEERETLSARIMVSSESARVQRTYPDIYMLIQDWRAAVLDHADRATLVTVREATQARLSELAARDAELAAHPPYIVVDARTDVRGQVALETERLRLLDGALGSR